MTEEQYVKIKDAYLENIKRYMLSSGSLFAHITVFGQHKDGDDKDAIIHIPIPDEFMKSEERKDKFMDDVFPEIASTIKKKFIPYGIGWAAEAWVRVLSKDEKMPKDWKSIPIAKEVVLVQLEFKEKKEAIVYEIKRLGKQVNEDGDLVDQIDLIEDPNYSSPESMSGRFSNLYEKFIGKD